MPETGAAFGGRLQRDKTFFFTGWEWLYDTFPEPGPFTVPTEAQRNGDFSALLSQGIRIYDPATAVRRADGRIEVLDHIGSAELQAGDQFIIETPGGGGWGKALR